MQGQLWDISMDESLVTMIQTLAAKLGVSPMNMDATMLRPEVEDMSRFKGE